MFGLIKILLEWSLNVTRSWIIYRVYCFDVCGLWEFFAKAFEFRAYEYLCQRYVKERHLIKLKTINQN